jgi:DNA-binding NarL/FixJ family response regulator
MRRRLDRALQESANQLHVMRAGCASLAEAFRLIGIARTSIIRFQPVLHLIKNLTPREIEVLTLIANGFSTKQIAFQLGIAFKTAVAHRSRLMMKLEVHETAGLVRVAISAGLVSPLGHQLTPAGISPSEQKLTNASTLNQAAG